MMYAIRNAQNGSEVSENSYSPAIWGDCPLAAIRQGVTPGVIMEDDFESFPITPATTEGNWSRYAQFSSTGGTITAGTGQGGEAIFASDGDNEGASIRTLATPFKIARTTKALWFEARLKFSTIADTKNGVFVGLMQDVALTATVPITAAGAIADTNLVGFHRLEGDGDQIDIVYKADGVTQVTVLADALTNNPTTTALVADTYIKLGMKYVPQGDNKGAYYLSFYFNNYRCATAYQIASADGTDFPNDIGLGLVLAILNATGTTPGNVTIDKWRCVQLL